MSLQRVEDTTPLSRPASGPEMGERQLAMLERQANIMARTDLVGTLKGKPADIAMIGMKAYALGVPLAAAFDDMFVIERKVTISARMRVALARAAGCEVWFDETTDQAATCCLRRPGQTRVHRLTYTIDQATKAGLAKKDNWAKHPAAMLRAAASRQLINMAAQDVLLGFPGGEGIDYEADVTDLDLPDDVVELGGRGLPEGDVPVVPAAEADIARLFERISDLDDDGREWLKGRIRAAQLPPVSRLHASQVATVDDLIDAAAEVGDCAADDTTADMDHQDVPDGEPF